MKTILFRIGTLDSGGAERVLINVLQTLNKEKYNITLLSETSGGVLEGSLPANIHHIFLFKGNNALSGFIGLKMFYKVYRKILISIIRAIPEVLYISGKIGVYDVEVTCLQDLAPYTIPRFYRYARHTRRIAWIHTDLMRNDYSPRLRSKIARSLIHFDAIMAVSEGVKKTLIALNAQLSPRIAVIQNVVLRNEILGKATDEIVLAQPHDLTIAFLGRLEKVKGVERLLICCQKLAIEGFKFTMLIIGDGSERKSLEQLVNTLQITSIVIFLGFKRNPYPYLKAADIFVLSSFAEGYPMVLTEAMVLGKAIIATKVSGVEEILNNGEYGLVVDNNDEALYQGLKSMVADAALRNSLKEKAVAGATQFSIEAVISRIEKTFFGQSGYHHKKFR